MAADDYLREVVAEVSQALGPLTDALENPVAVVDLLALLGWEVEPEAAETLTNAFTDVATALTALADDANNNADLGTLTGDVGALSAALVGATPAVTDGLPAPFDN